MAFDNINWDMMFKVHRDIKVDYGNRRIILQLYKDQRALTSRDGFEAKTSKAVRQLWVIPITVQLLCKVRD